MENALGGGIDPREIDRQAYAYDGNETITEHMQDGSVNIHTGDNGDPDFLVAHIREALGTCIAIETVGKDLPPGQMMDAGI